MLKKKNSYRESRNQSIDENIERLKKAGIRFHYDRKERHSYQTPSNDFHQNTKNFIRITVILVMSSGIVAWLFSIIFKSVL